MKALIKGSRIIQVATETFPVHPDYAWHDVSEGVTTAWSWDGRQAVPPDPEPATERRARLKRYLSRLGKRKRTAAVGLNPADPDADSQFLMMLAEAAMLVNERAAGRSSDNARLDNQLKPMAQAVIGLGQAQRAIAVKIDDDTYTTKSDIDAASEWP